MPEYFPIQKTSIVSSTNIGTYCKDDNGTVFLNISAQLLTGLNGTNQVVEIGKLPVGYRPAASLRAFVELRSFTTGLESANIVVEKDGTIYVCRTFASSSTSMQIITGSTSYKSALI